MKSWVYSDVVWKCCQHAQVFLYVLEESWAWCISSSSKAILFTLLIQLAIVGGLGEFQRIGIHSFAALRRGRARDRWYVFIGSVEW